MKFTILTLSTLCAFSTALTQPPFLPTGVRLAARSIQFDSNDETWARLQHVTEGIHEKTGRIVYNARELEKADADLVLALKNANVQLEVPKTVAAALATFLSTDTAQFVLSALATTGVFRLAISPLGLPDLVTVFVTRVFWEIQEWVFHSQAFHGNEDFTAHHPFKIHDVHHNLPYFHVAIEPVRMGVLWFIAVFSLYSCAVALGAPMDLAATSLGTYIACGLTYIATHFLTHSKVPLTGWLQMARENHIKHHISPKHHLNMGPNNIDRIMGTTSYADRLGHSESEA